MNQDNPVAKPQISFRKERLRIPIKEIGFVLIIFYLFAFLDAIKNLWIVPLISVVFWVLLLVISALTIIYIERRLQLVINPSYLGEYSNAPGRWKWRVHFVTIEKVITYYDERDNLFAIELIAGENKHLISHYVNLDEILSSIRKNLPEITQSSREKAKKLNTHPLLLISLVPALLFIIWQGLDLPLHQTLVLMFFLFLNVVFWPQVINRIKSVRNNIISVGFLFEILVVGLFLTFLSSYDQAIFAPSPCSWIGMLGQDLGCVRSIQKIDSLALVNNARENKLIMVRDNILTVNPIDWMQMGGRRFYVHDVGIRDFWVNENKDQIFLLSFAFVPNQNTTGSLNDSLLLMKDLTMLDSHSLEILERKEGSEHTTFGNLIGTIGSHTDNEARSWDFGPETEKYLVIFSDETVKVWDVAGWEPEIIDDPIERFFSQNTIFVPEKSSLYSLHSENEIFCAGFLRNGDRLYLQDRNGIAVFDSQTGKFLFSKKQNGRFCAVASDLNLMILHQQNFVDGKWDSANIEIVQAQSGKTLATIPLNYLPGDVRVTISHDGRYLAIYNPAKGFIFDLEVLIPDLDEITRVNAQ